MWIDLFSCFGFGIGQICGSSLSFCHRQFYFLDYWFKCLTPFQIRKNCKLLLEVAFTVCISMIHMR